MHVDVVQHAHGVGLAGARLAVDEVSTIVAIEHVADQRYAGFVEDGLLVHLLIIDPVKRVDPPLLLGQREFNKLVVLVVGEGALPLVRHFVPVG